MKRPAYMDRLRTATADTPLSELTGAICSASHSAKNIVNRAKRIGVLKAAPCAHCGGADRINGHHHDYFRPLDVTSLCDGCHKAEHRRLRSEGVKIPGAGADRRSCTADERAA